MDKSTYRTKVGLAEMLRGGVIMDVVNAEQARLVGSPPRTHVARHLVRERPPALLLRHPAVAAELRSTFLEAGEEGLGRVRWRRWSSSTSKTALSDMSRRACAVRAYPAAPRSGGRDAHLRRAALLTRSS